MNARAAFRISLLLVLLAGAQDAHAATRRFLLAAGANSGGADRVPLRYAVADARSFADIMVGMGGVRSDDRIVLDAPDRSILEAAFATLEERITHVAGDERAEIIFYYSGHADERGLLMGGDRLSYADLRTRIAAVPATVRITVLDACASGTITRLKGGERRPAFLIDDSVEMEGYAFLTSSSADEAAQESDAIGASYFTHSLVSGLRGAADVSGEGKISLTEAYQFAFNETLARTTELQAGAQHPSYHINLSGTGDVVMTDVRETSAGLVLAEDLRGRLFVRDDDEHLVAELYKPEGRQVVLGLGAGAYEIHMSREPELWVARVELARDEMLMLVPAHFEATDRQPSVVRGGGGAWPPREGFLGPLAGRWRLGLGIGYYAQGIEDGDSGTGFVTTSAGSQNLMLELAFSRWLREDTAFGLRLMLLDGEASTSTGIDVSTKASGIVGFRVGLRKYGPRSTFRSSFRPFVSVDAEALMASQSSTRTGISGVETSTEVQAAFGVLPGAGVDFLVGRHFLVGTTVGYNLLTDFAEPFAGRRNYSGLEASVNLNWVFGSGF